MGTRLIFLGQAEVTKAGRCHPLIGLGMAAKDFQEIALPYQTVPETDTGGLVEYTEALERTVLKELGKLPP